jgi:tetratricopeptide (TPR) repeat protein
MLALAFTALLPGSVGFSFATEPEEPDEIRIPSHPPDPKDAGFKTEIAGYTQLAREAADHEKWPLADHFLRLLVELPCEAVEKKAALREISEHYEKHRQFTKAITILEKMIELFPGDSELPHFFFKAGMLYRETGAYGRSVSRFYSVLNTALKINERGIDTYRDLSQRAQMEIAETYLLTGEYKQAAKFFQLLARGELSAEQRAKVGFKALHCHYLLDDSAAAVVAAEKFLTEYSNDSSVPEVRFIQASALRSLGRKKEAFDAVLALLRVEKEKRESNPDRWAYWQKKTGNEFANGFYQQGDFISALTIYQTLAKLGEEPEWQWPVIYQMGLTFERLRLVSRAGEAYKYIIDQSKKIETGGTKLPESLANLLQMAQWRGEQLAWHYTAESQLQRLLGEPQAASAAGIDLPNPPTTTQNTP